ncbi:hypothetical protein K7I13_08825 [Brucepastera parasyntrophica]|uniref:hypothetical protein n=1 Tax=Brucepastera parasyntrophica TaxID=2880008 RepID=UPI00210D1D1C|nr:hypothetical protein [Brucepastera parasyntrophica]ULQ58662.1 hypothetical protein K7I13_08825 [Brucepastera parasyntrophica]
MKKGFFIFMVLLLTTAGTAFAQSDTEAYVQKLLAYAGNLKTVEDQTLVYYNISMDYMSGGDSVTLIVCKIIPNSRGPACDVTIYTGFAAKSSYDFYKNSKTMFSDDQRAEMTFVDEMQCYFINSPGESFPMRQNLANSGGRVIVR